MIDGAGEEWLDHGDVADDDGNEGFADGPAASCLGAIGSGLGGWHVSGVFSVQLCDGRSGRLLTVRMRTQRRIPAIVTKIPPLNMIRSQVFFFNGICAFQNS